MKLGVFVVDEMVVIGCYLGYVMIQTKTIQIRPEIRTNIEGQLPRRQVNRHRQMSSPCAGTFDLHLGSSHLNPELH
jgi:hypothetical protein